MGRHAMIGASFNIEDWKVILFIAKDSYNIDKIIDELVRLECPTQYIKEAYLDMTEVIYNTGFTYSNYSLRKSVMVIGIQNSDEQAINTIAHESRHLQQHIANYKGLDQNSEDVCYLIGNIVQIITTIKQERLGS